MNNIEENNKISIEKDYNGNWCFSLAEKRRETFAQVFCVYVCVRGELLSVGDKKRDC